MSNFIGLTSFSEKSTSKKVLSLLMNIFALLCAAFVLTAFSLWFAPGDYTSELFESYFQNPLIIILSFLPIAYLMFFLWFLTGRSCISFSLTAVLTIGLTLGNYFKLRFRDDSLMFADLLILREAKEMAGRYDIVLSASIIICLVLVFVIAIAFAVFSVKKFRPKTQLICALISLLLAYPLSFLYSSEDIYINKTENNSLINQWSSTQVFVSKGFIYPFLHSVSDAFPQAPESYSKQGAEQLLSAYENADIPEDEKVNMIGIMLESFCDFSEYDQISFSRDIYAGLHELEDESYSGKLVTNIFAGGTCNSERAFLTGFSSPENFRGNTNSYVWYFKDQGYTTTGDHPCFQWFYNRSNINRYLGFDSYRFVENYYGTFTDGDVGYDDVFFPQLQEHCHDLISEDAPLFSFSISYQGHGPYEENFCWWGYTGDFVQNAGYTDAEQNILDNYFGSVYNTIGHVCDFVDSFRDTEEPVVIVIFGDHKPWLGDSSSVYETLGISLDTSTQEGYMNYYSTPYLIWANDAAKAALGNDFVGEGPDIGPYFLMDQLFSLCGWDGPAYMQATDACSKQIPVINPDGFYFENDKLCSTLSPEGQSVLKDYLELQYYYTKNFRG